MCKVLYFPLASINTCQSKQKLLQVLIIGNELKI